MNKKNEKNVNYLTCMAALIILINDRSKQQNILDPSVQVAADGKHRARTSSLFAVIYVCHSVNERVMRGGNQG